MEVITVIVMFFGGILVAKTLNLFRLKRVMMFAVIRTSYGNLNYLNKG